MYAQGIVSLYQRSVRRKAQLSFLCANLHKETRAELFFVRSVDIGIYIFFFNERLLYGFSGFGTRHIRTNYKVELNFV